MTKQILCDLELTFESYNKHNFGAMLLFIWKQTSIKEMQALPKKQITREY